MLILTTVKHDTAGRERLVAIGKGPSDLWKELKDAAPGMNLDISTVSRWRSGDIRPEAFWRTVMLRVFGIPEADWLSTSERVALTQSGKGAA